MLAGLNRLKANTFREFHCHQETDERTENSVFLQSQRDCVLQPRVARNELPWVAARQVFNPNGVVSRGHGWTATPLGWVGGGVVSQGSSCLATQGFEPESLWDSALEFPKGIRLKAEFRAKLPPPPGTETERFESELRNRRAGISQRRARGAAFTPLRRPRTRDFPLPARRADRKQPSTSVRG